LHLPGEIKGIDAVAEHYPGLSQVVCFDTAFHRRMPDVAQWLPIVRSLRHEGIHRYGFHGLSYEYIVSALGMNTKGRVIIAHLGSGASMAALNDGHPQDTTMGFSGLGGLMMGTRCGDLDPGVLLYLMDEKGYDARQLERLLYQRSGLIGVSGISSDMKTLLDQCATEPHAAEAIELFCYTARKYIGALSAVLGGLDTLVFTGGIGERAAPVRWSICDGLEYLGIKLDSKNNNANADTISITNSSCTVRVIPTNEDLMIARHTRSLLLKGKQGEEP
jgi:acetate kinase